MRQRYLLMVSILLAICCFNALQAQTQIYDLRVLVERNDQTVGGFFDIKVQIQSDGSSPFAMGTSNLVFEYNTSAISSPTLQTAHNFSGGNYSTMTVTEPVSGRVSTNIELQGVNNGTTVASSYMDVVTIRFTISVTTLTSDIVWRTASPNPTVVFVDDQTTIATPDDLNGLDVALPVELSSFTANVVDGEVVLNWTTESETNNLGFNIERSQDEIDFQKIGFVKGNGTTTIPQQYVFEDENLAPGTYFYRLKQIDLDGAFEYSAVINVTVSAPKEFALAQNYPNPFNPETTIRYDLPVPTHVVLKIYNVLGEKVRTLVNADQSAGIINVTWDGTNNAGEPVASGVYFYRLNAGDFSKTLKLMLMK